MYFHSRLLTLQAQPEKANDVLQKALNMPLEYVQVSIAVQCYFTVRVLSHALHTAASTYLSCQYQKRAISILD